MVAFKKVDYLTQELFQSRLDLGKGGKADLCEHKSNPAAVPGPFPWLPGADPAGLGCVGSLGVCGVESQLSCGSLPGHTLAPALLFPGHRVSEVLQNFLCFNKCVFTNVSLGENIFLLFLWVASLGLCGSEANSTASGSFFPCSVLFFPLSFFLERK